MDPHPRYLTSAALFAATDNSALLLHDRAVASLHPSAEARVASRRDDAPYGSDSIHVVHRGRDTQDVEARDAARTLTARAVSRARQGNFKGARSDLQASMARQPTPLAIRWLAHLSEQALD